MVTPQDNVDPLPVAEIRRLCGDLPDWKVAAIAATGASLDEILAATTWADGGDDLMGEERRRLSDATAAVYDLLVCDDDLS